VTDPLPEAPGFYRDAIGALKRQSARFRVYGLNAARRAVTELTADKAEIGWTVHLANRKSAWYQFQIALDIPEAGSAPTSWLRNLTIADRNRLVIDPGARHISDRDTSGGPAYSFDTGTFLGTRVYLGEIRTDSHGRLIVFGGRGKSASYNGARAVTFANNEGWHDDTSDGPVTAEVTKNRYWTALDGYVRERPSRRDLASRARAGVFAKFKECLTKIHHTPSRGGARDHRGRLRCVRPAVNGQPQEDGRPLPTFIRRTPKAAAKAFTTASPRSPLQHGVNFVDLRCDVALRHRCGLGLGQAADDVGLPLDRHLAVAVEGRQRLIVAHVL
jgi:L-Lysine epsilon oxidase N-terminal